MKAFFWTSPLSLFLCCTLINAPVWAQSPLPTGPSAPAYPDALQIRVLNSESLRGTLHTAAKESLQVEVLDGAGAAVSNAAVICRLPDTGATGVFADGTHAAIAYTDAAGHATITPVEWGDVPGTVSIRLTATKGNTHAGILLETTLAASAAAAQMLPKQTAIPASQMVVSVPAVSVTKPAQPGQLAKSAPSAGLHTQDVNTGAAPDPTVSVTRTPAADAPHNSHAKWYVLLAVVAAAGAGAAFSMKGKSNTTAATNNTSLTIGAPTVSVGSGH